MLDFGSVPLAMPVKEAPSSKLDDCCLLGTKLTPRRSGDTKDQATLFLKGGGLPVGMGSDELMLEVTCGQNQAALYMSRLQLGSKGTCVLFENSWLTPNEFQYISGRETAKDWKRSIKHHGKSLKVLISKGILTTSPLRCNCGQCSTTTNVTAATTAQSKDKDASKYVVTDDVKMTPGSSLRDAYTTVVTKRVKPDCSKDTGERRFYGGAPGESNENRKDAPGESKTLQQRTPAEQCLTSHSLGGARYPPSCEYGKMEEMGLQLNGGYRLPIGCGQAGKKESCKYASSSSSSADDAKMRQKQSLEAKENAFSKEGPKLSQTVYQQKTGNDGIKVNTIECSASGMTSQKRSTSSGTRPGTSGPGGTWSQTSYHLEPSSESTGTKPTHHDKTIKSTLSSPSSSSSSSSSTSSVQVNSNPSCVADKPSCSQVNPGKIPASNNNNVGLASDNNNPSRMSSSSSSDPSYLFPSFGSPYYPMIPAPQLPAYYPNPYMWSMPFSTNPSTCSYGWTAPSDMMCAPGCLRSPGKEPLDCGGDQAFNFPWMKRSGGYPSSATDRDTVGEPATAAALSSSSASSSGKRKLDCDQSPSDYFPATKHPLYMSPDNLRSTYGDSVAWPGYNPNAALDFRFLPYNIPSYIPDIRPTHGLFASNFLKGSENPAAAASGFGLYPGLFPSPCLGVNSR